MTAALFANAAIDGSSIPNAHVVYETEGSQIIRGKAPANTQQLQELIDLGVSEFIIFKNDVKGEVEKEKAALLALGIAPRFITHIAFPWKDLHDFKSACTMTVKALKTIENSVKKNRSLYFHCTVGEDRTGYLAGLWGLWVGTYTSVPQSVQQELCDRGYEAGNRAKPYQNVVLKIRETLTPTYLKMVMILGQARQNNQGLDVRLCDSEPELTVNVSKYYCAKGVAKE